MYGKVSRNDEAVDAHASMSVRTSICMSTQVRGRIHATRGGTVVRQPILPAKTCGQPTPSYCELTATRRWELTDCSNFSLIRRPHFCKLFWCCERMVVDRIDAFYDCRNLLRDTSVKANIEHASVGIFRCCLDVHTRRLTRHYVSLVWIDSRHVVAANLDG